MRFDSVANSARRTYAVKTRIRDSTEKKIAFVILQSFLFKSFYLIHLNIKRQLFINLNVNKKFEFKIIIYHVKTVWNDKIILREIYLNQFFFQSIIFIDRNTLLIYRVEINWYRMNIEKNTTHDKNLRRFVVYCHLHKSRNSIEYRKTNYSYCQFYR